MKNINEGYPSGSEGNLYNEDLSIFCVDSVGIKARITFDSCLLDGIQFTYWMNEAEDLKRRINSIFDLLFEEVVRIRYSNKDYRTIKDDNI